MKYLKQFVIGSSYLIFLPFFLLVKNSLPEKTYSYYTYTITAPVYFGVWNVLSLVLAEYFGLLGWNQQAPVIPHRCNYFEFHTNKHLIAVHLLVGLV